VRYVKNQYKRQVDGERRRFLGFVKNAGISTAMLRCSPLVLGALSTRYAEAAAGAGKRAVFMYLPDGSPPGHWLPKSANQMNTATTPFGNGTNAVTGYNVAQHCHFYEVNNSWNEHGQTYKCMGHRGQSAQQYQNTLDTLLAKRNFFPSQYDIVRIGVKKKEAGFSLEDSQAAPFIDGPRKAFNDLFSGVAVNKTDNTYKRVFEMNARAIDSLKNQFSGEERERLEGHLAAVEQIEQDLTKAAQAGQNAEACEVNAPGNPQDFLDECMQTADVVVAALKCGLTNVASIMLSDNQAEWEIPKDIRSKLNLPVGSPQTYHSSNHSEQQIGKEGIGKFLSVLSQVPAYFISRLATEVAAGESAPLLQSTLFVQLNDMGYGDHTAPNAPWILASASPDYGVNGFGRGGYSTNTQLLQSIPGRMGLDGALTGDY